VKNSKLVGNHCIMTDLIEGKTDHESQKNALNIVLVKRGNFKTLWQADLSVQAILKLHASSDTLVIARTRISCYNIFMITMHNAFRPAHPI